MHQSLVKFSESEPSNHMPSLADFTTTTPELKVFGTHRTPAPFAPASTSIEVLTSLRQKERGASEGTLLIARWNLRFAAEENINLT